MSRRRGSVAEQMCQLLVMKRLQRKKEENEKRWNGRYNELMDYKKEVSLMSQISLLSNSDVRHYVLLLFIVLPYVHQY